MTVTYRQSLSCVQGDGNPPPVIPVRDPLLRRSVCAVGQPAHIQVSRCVRLSESDRDFPALTGRSGTQRARPLRPELAAVLGGWPVSQLTEGVGDSSCLLLPGVGAVLGCCIVTARTVQGMARVRSGQALAWPLSSDRSVRRDIRCG
jgi:hypothetical protein